MKVSPQYVSTLGIPPLEGINVVLLGVGLFSQGWLFIQKKKSGPSLWLPILLYDLSAIAPTAMRASAMKP